MVLERLGEGLRNITKKISSVIFFDRNTVESIVKDIQRILLESDVDIKLAYEIGEKIKRLAGNEKIKGIERKEQLVKLIHDEILSLVGKEKNELIIDKKIKPFKIMLLGLYGSGKTTSIAKLAFYYKKRGFKVCMLGLDVHRPAAPEQLEQLGQKIEVATFINKQEKKALKIYQEFEEKIKGYDLCFIDTAGRDALDVELINEIKELKNKINPSELILVIPADIGQAAKKQTSEFQKACNITGVIITRMDGTGKAGGALVACKETNSKVYFIGTGEHVSDLEIFNPKSFVSRLLGMGDIETLVEKVQSASEGGDKTKRRIEEGKFTLLDMYEQIKSVQNIGPLGKITELIPGMAALKEKLSGDVFDKQGEKIKHWKNAIDSMTIEEIENPDILEKQTSRISRISKGSGVKGSEIRELLSQYKILKSFVINAKNPEESMEDIMKGKIPSGMSRKQLMKLAKKYKGKMF